MKVAMIQMNVKVGHLEENMNVMRGYIEEAKKQECDIVIFPQNAVSGYLLGDQWLDVKWCQAVDRYNAELTALANGIAIVWGNVKYRHGHLFNCAFFAHDGMTHMRVKRNEHGGYGNDARYFEENAIHDLIEYKDHLFSLEFHHDYHLADWAINLDCAHYQMKEQWTPKANTLYVNPVGMQTCGKHVLLYAGGTGVYQDKQWKKCVKDHEVGMLVVELDEPIQKETYGKSSLLDTVLAGIKQFDEQILGGKLPWIVGLSGGLDSSVSAALLALALGKDRVFGFNMATKYNSIETVSNAKSLANALGISYEEGSIEELTNASVSVVKSYGYDETKWPSLVYENIQARIRGHLLSTFASIHGGVVVNNGNKVELALGYCTLYGDAIGAVSLLGDMSKVTLFDLSHAINEKVGKEVIPYCLLPVVNGNTIDWEVPPSAELKDDQLDPMKWFYHDYLVDHRVDFPITTLMQCYLDGSIQDHVLYRWIKYYGLDKPEAFIKDLDWFTNTMIRNQFKHVQVPPIFVVSNQAFGGNTSQSRFDCHLYEQLREAILKMAS